MKILGSLIFCFIALALFLSVTAMSRHTLPAGLEELHGDITGIHSLIIEGEVFSWEGRYAYSFTIAPGRQRTRMHVFNNSRTLDEFRQRRFHDLHREWRTSVLRLAYLPLDDTQPITTYSDRSFFIDHTGRHIPISEYRIYGEIFAVKPLFLFSYPLYTPMHEHRLFMYAGPDSYIYTWRNDYNRHFQWTDWHLVRDGFLMPASSLNFFNAIQIGDRYLIVPTGTGLFGSTAVYAVYMPGNLVPTVGCLYNNMVEASVLFPITIERDKDEVIGLLEWDKSVLLFISRANGLEVTRINPENGENRTIFVETDAFFNQHFLCENYLVLHGRRRNGIGEAIAVFDLQNDDINVVSVFNIRPSDEVGLLEVHDIILYNGVVYIAHIATPTSWPQWPSETKTFISAFDNDGKLIGRAQVLSGVEDDTFWTRVGGGWAQRYRRELQSLTFRRQH